MTAQAIRNPPAEPAIALNVNGACLSCAAMLLASVETDAVSIARAKHGGATLEISGPRSPQDLAHGEFLTNLFTTFFAKGDNSTD
ncbi:hypothetical protein D3C75_1273820 [compost metagenome]